LSWTLFALLVEASVYTVVLSGVSITLGLFIGMAVAGGLLAQSPWLWRPARLFVSFFRGVPLLVQLLLLYNLLPAIGIDVPGWVAAIIGLTLCTAAYQAETLRGGFSAVPKGLLVAADMVGLDPFQQFRRIRAPIAFRLTLPSLVNEAIMILKASSLVSVVGVVELTRMAQDLSASTYQPLPLYASAGLLYYGINRLLAWLGSEAERRLAWGRT
jgi:polar amino acid transport system permease protein